MCILVSRTMQLVEDLHLQITRLESLGHTALLSILSKPNSSEKQQESVAMNYIVCSLYILLLILKSNKESVILFFGFHEELPGKLIESQEGQQNLIGKVHSKRR